MSKDPAFLFYSNDFLTGCADLTMDERGYYITLMCFQHQKKRLTKKTLWLSLGFSSVCKFDDFDEKKFIPLDVLKKFQQDSEGNYFNQKLEDVILQRAAFTDSRRKNGAKGGRPRKPSENLEESKSEPTQKPKHILHEDVNINENESLISNKNNDPYVGDDVCRFKKVYSEVFGNTPYLTQVDLFNLADRVAENKDFFLTLKADLEKVKAIDFENIDYKPAADWFLKAKNYGNLKNKTYDKKIAKNISKAATARGNSFIAQAQELERKGL